MAKQWMIERNEVEIKAEAFSKPYNADKYNELYEQMDQVCDAFKNKDKVSTLTRKIVEEAMNVIEHNKSWNELRVRTEFNKDTGKFKAEIIYDGGEYYDPEKNNIGNVAGSTDRFKEYRREIVIKPDEDKRVEIRLNIIL